MPYAPASATSRVEVTGPPPPPLTPVLVLSSLAAIILVALTARRTGKGAK